MVDCHILSSVQGFVKTQLEDPFMMQHRTFHHPFSNAVAIALAFLKYPFMTMLPLIMNSPILVPS